MNEIDIQFFTEDLSEHEDRIHAFTDSALKNINIDNWSLSMVFTGDDHIKDLNEKYRDRKGPTDILTFCEIDTGRDWVNGNTDENFYAGDIIISTETLRKNAEYFNVNFIDELKRLIIHGILHLKGFDHKTNNDDEDMLIYQEKILKDLGDFEF